MPYAWYVFSWILAGHFLRFRRMKPRVLLLSLQMLLICDFQLRFRWMVTPKCFASSTVLSGVPWMEYGVVPRITFVLLVILSTLHLSALKDMIHFFSHSGRLRRSFSRIAMSSWDWIVLNRSASSAKRGILVETHSGRSLMKTKNSRGLNTIL